MKFFLSGLSGNIVVVGSHADREDFIPVLEDTCVESSRQSVAYLTHK